MPAGIVMDGGKEMPAEEDRNASGLVFVSVKIFQLFLIYLFCLVKLCFVFGNVTGTGTCYDFT
jgi:hypothetical protein